MAIKKNELYSSLWAACDELRGGMDASQYKDYILTLLFVKYVSDKYRHADTDNPYSTGVKVPPGASFYDMVDLPNDQHLGENMNKVIGCLIEANPETFAPLRNVLNGASFTDETKLGQGKELVEKLRNLINIFRKEELDFSNNRADDDDLIGDAYEYLMRNFATQSGKSKGQFYTPAEVSRILATLIGIEKTTRGQKTTLYDPACGSGSLLIRAARRAPCPIDITGQENDSSTTGLAKMNMVLHRQDFADIRWGSTFANPLVEKGTLRRFDYIVANPPFSLKNWTNGLASYGLWDGFDEPPETNGDMAWLLHIIKSLKDTGCAAVIMPHGVLFRGNAEENIRKEILRRGYIEGVIGLPPNLFYGTPIPACVVVLDKAGAAGRKNIFMINATEGFRKDGNKNRLREQDIYRITTTYAARDSADPHYARNVPVAEILDANNGNLNITRYVPGRARDDAQNIDGHLRGGIPDEDIDTLEQYWAVFPDLRQELFRPLRPGFSALAQPKEEVREFIHAYPQYTAYGQKLRKAFAAWAAGVRPLLAGIDAKTDPAKLRDELAEKLFACFDPYPLLDRYAVYDELLNYWNETMSDDVHVVSAEGFGAARGLETLWKTGTGKDKGKQKEAGKEGVLVPKALVAQAFFADELRKLASLNADQDDRQAQLDAVLDEMDDGTDAKDAVLNDKGKLIAAPEFAALVKSPPGSFGPQERAWLTKLDAARKAHKSAGSAVTKQEKRIDALALGRYAGLTDEEIDTLLIDKKWLAAIETGIMALYTAVAHTITERVLTLASRYDRTLSELEADTAALEAKVRAHLKRMGY